jgi:hypothetical protein
MVSRVVSAQCAHDLNPHGHLHIDDGDADPFPQVAPGPILMVPAQGTAQV